MVTSDMIRSARVRLGESQSVFGSRFGVDQSTVHRWEMGAPPRRGSALILLTQLLATIGISAYTPNTREART